MSRIRLNRLLATAGFGSRRACDDLIADGRVSIDGQICRTLGVQVDPERQDVRCDRQRVRPARPVVYAFHKPRGVICTDRPGSAPRVIDFWPPQDRRLFTVGRLDADSSGLLLVTNDGLLANRIAHPRYAVPKTYRVRVRGGVPPEKIARLREGVWLSEGPTSEADVRVLGREPDRTVLLITIREGRNREIRRMLARLGFKVQRLTRVAIGALPIGKLAPGQWRVLTDAEQARLTVDAPPPAHAVEPPGRPRHGARPVRRRPPRRRRP